MSNVSILVNLCDVWCAQKKNEATLWHALVLVLSLLAFLRQFSTPEALLVSKAGTLCKCGFVEAIACTEMVEQYCLRNTTWWLVQLRTLNQGNGNALRRRQSAL